MNRNIILSLVFSLFIVGFSLYATKCHGEFCGQEASVIRSNEIVNIEKMNSEDVVKRALSGEIILVDVREEYEWDTGHIEGAKNIPLSILSEDTLSTDDKNKEIFVYCRSGARAENAKNFLNGLGYKNVTNLGGVIDWQANGGQLVIN